MCYTGAHEWLASLNRCRLCKRQIGLGDCLDRTWDVTDSFFGGSNGVPNSKRCRINRAYARVSRDKMQANLKSRLASAGVVKLKGRVDAATVSEQASDQVRRVWDRR